MLESGFLGFYQGCMTNLLRTTPAAAVTFTSFELINKRLRLWLAEPEVKGAEKAEEEEKVALAPPFASINAHVSELKSRDLK